MLSRGQSEIPKLAAIGERGSRTSAPQARLPALTQAEPLATRGAELPITLLSDVIESAEDAIMIADMREAGAPIVHVNSAFEDITGYTRAEAIGKSCRYLQGHDRLQPEIARLREAIATGTSCRARLRNYRKDGSLFWNDLHLVPMGNESGNPTHFVGYMRDATELVTTGVQLRTAVQIDSLTSCLSRDALQPALAKLTAENSVLVVKLDVAHFHDINSGFGYDLGDLLLKEIASRLRQLDAALVARLGSDQFALVFPIDNRAEAPEKLERIAALLHGRYDLPGAGLTVRFAIGYAVGVAGCDGLRLVRQAGAALAQSKTSRLHEPHEFQTDSEELALRRVRLAGELQYAISSNELVYYYQPKIDLITGEFVGAEALLRWNHGVFGMQPPDRFIGLAEETGLILDIGAKGFYAVASFAASVNQWRRRPLRFSINVSAIEFTHRDMVAFVSKVLQDTGADPAWLTLELTESLLAPESGEMLSIFGRLRELGVGLSIDDFGTGYSCLRYLERFPVTEIKIDRSFVADLQHSATKRIIVASVIELGAVLNIDVVAEGIENEAERAMLRSMNCPLGQGHLFSRPLPAESFVTFARDGMLSPAMPI